MLEFSVIEQSLSKMISTLALNLMMLEVLFEYTTLILSGFTKKVLALSWAINHCFFAVCYWYFL